MDVNDSPSTKYALTNLLQYYQTLYSSLSWDNDKLLQVCGTNGNGIMKGYELKECHSTNEPQDLFYAQARNVLF